MKVVTKLLELNTDINHLDRNGWSALLFAAKKGHAEVVKKLLSVNADIHLTADGRENNYDANVLLIATLENQFEVSFWSV